MTGQVTPQQIDPQALREQLLSLPLEERRRIIQTLPHSARVALAYNWRFNARAKQLPPEGRWSKWLVMAGRGFGKTRTGAEWVNEVASRDPTARIALVGRTGTDARDVMVEGESGIIAKSPPWFMPRLVRKFVYWPNGAQARIFSAEEPDELRGPQHTHAWCDELAAWKYMDTWDQLLFGLRLGDNPQALITTTPRPIPVVKGLLEEAKDDPREVRVVRGGTRENEANLARTFLTQIVKKFEGTRLGRQELDGEVLEDTPGALWKLKAIDEDRVKRCPELVRIVVAVDPAVTAEEGSAETGIVVAGVGYPNPDSEELHAYVLDDRSELLTANEWAQRAVQTLKDQQADRIVAEVNNGGDLVEINIRTVDPMVPYKAVHASRGKRTRAEPVSALYEQHKVHHVGAFKELEDQMCTWQPAEGKSPDRVDALVWAITELLLDEPPSNASKVLNDDTVMPRARFAEDTDDDEEDDRPAARRF